MNRRKYTLTMLMVATLGVAAVSIDGQVFAQGMGSGGAMMGDSPMMQALGGMSWPDTLEVVAVSGVALIEKGHVHDLYVLDTDGDGIADYRLSFGPWWYAPESGAVRPGEGEAITLKGGLYPVPGEANLLVVFEINGLQWRDQQELLPWSGGWMHGVADTTFFNTPMDSLSWVGFPSGVMGDLRERMMGMMGRGVTPDSVYIHFEVVGSDRIPGPVDSAMVAGYHVGLSDPWGNDLMEDTMAMSFSHGIEMHFHYDADGIGTGNLSGHDLALKALSSDREWVEVPDAAVDPVASTVSLNTQRVFAYYALFATAPVPTAVAEEATGPIPADFALLQNFPNPFNPTTMIRYDLPTEGRVRLEIFNALGQPIRTLVDGPQQAGPSVIRWDGRDEAGQSLPSGLYFYRLRAGGFVQVRKMVLVK